MEEEKANSPEKDVTIGDLDENTSEKIPEESGEFTSRESASLSSCEMARLNAETKNVGMDLEALQGELDRFREDLMDEFVSKMIDEKLEEHLPTVKEVV